MITVMRVRTALTGWVGGPGLMTQYFTSPTEDITAATHARAYVHTLIGTALGLVFTNQVTWVVAPEVDIVDPATGHTTATFVEDTVHSATGGGGPTMAPPACAGLVQWLTGTYIAGRSIKGRSFIGPMAEEHIDASGQVLDATKTAVDAALYAYLGGIDYGDAQVVWHRPKAGAGGSAHPVSTGTIEKKVAVLTSRRD